MSFSAPSCPRCRFGNSAGSRFCAQCGAPLAAPVVPPKPEPTERIDVIGRIPFALAMVACLSIYPHLLGMVAFGSGIGILVTDTDRFRSDGWIFPAMGVFLGAMAWYYGGLFRIFPT